MRQMPGVGAVVKAQQGDSRPEGHGYCFSLAFTNFKLRSGAITKQSEDYLSTGRR